MKSIKKSFFHIFIFTYIATICTFSMGTEKYKWFNSNTPDDEGRCAGLALASIYMKDSKDFSLSPQLRRYFSAGINLYQDVFQKIDLYTNQCNNNIKDFFIKNPACFKSKFSDPREAEFSYAARIAVDSYVAQLESGVLKGTKWGMAQMGCINAKNYESFIK